MKINRILVVAVVLGMNLMLSSCSGLIDAIFDSPTQETTVTPKTGESLELDANEAQSQANAQ